MGSCYQEFDGGNGLTAVQLREKYRDYVSDCQYMDGHGGYTGTFAEKPELRIMAGTWTKDTAEEHCLKHNDKWGPSFAYQLDTGGWYVGGWCSS